MTDETTAGKPFHLLTPQERTALRIAQNKAMNERIALTAPATKPSRTKSTREIAKPTGTAGFIRATPEERAELKIGTVVRKVQS